jgi:hypothetical protein
MPTAIKTMIETAPTTPPTTPPTEIPLASSGLELALELSEAPPVGEAGELLLLVDEAVGVEAPEETGVVPPLAVGVGALVDKRAARSIVSCFADGLADSSEENVLFSCGFPTVVKGSGAVAQQMFFCPSVLVHISLQHTATSVSVRQSTCPAK